MVTVTAGVTLAIARQEGKGPDVRLMAYGVEEEIEATAEWLTRCVSEGTALEEVAVLVPTLDPLAGLVAERLARLPWADGAHRPAAPRSRGGPLLT